MTDKYCNAQQEQDIKTMYATGKYSHRKLADMYCLSKSTIFNILKGYPWQHKEARYYRLQLESAANLEEAISNSEHCAHKAYERKNFLAYGNHIQRWLALLAAKEAAQGKTHETLTVERLKCEQRAWEAFGQGDYVDFGYQMETWVVLNEAIADNTKDPWKVLALKLNAKGKSKNVRFSGVERRSNKVLEMSDKKTDKLQITISPDLWDMIQDYMPKVYTNNNRQALECILNSLAHGYSFTQCRSFKRSTLYYRFELLYREEVLKLLLEIVPQYKELEPAAEMLYLIERHRLLYGSKHPPSLAQLRKGANNYKQQDKGCQEVSAMSAL